MNPQFDKSKIKPRANKPRTLFDALAALFGKPDGTCTVVPVEEHSRKTHATYNQAATPRRPIDPD